MRHGCRCGSWPRMEPGRSPAAAQKGHPTQRTQSLGPLTSSRLEEGAEQTVGLNTALPGIDRVD